MGIINEQNSVLPHKCRSGAEILFVILDKKNYAIKMGLKGNKRCQHQLKIATSLSHNYELRVTDSETDYSTIYFMSNNIVCALCRLVYIKTVNP